MTGLQVLVPGENIVEGDVPNAGKSGVPNTQTAGVSFNIAVGSIRAIDAFYNTVSTTGTVTVTLSDMYGTPASQTVSLSNGGSAAPVPITLAVSTDTFSPQVVYVNAFSLPTSTSSAIPVNTGAPARLQILLPNQSAVPGSATGKTGSPLATTAGTSYSVTVRMTDARFNRVAQASQPTVWFNTGDNFAVPSPNTLTLTPASGQGTDNFTFQTASSGSGWKIGVATTALSAVTVSSDTSDFVVVGTTTTDHILLILPGEFAVPGSPTGFSGTPAAAFAGTVYVSTVTTTDRFYNPTSNITPLIQMVTTDPYDTDPATTTVIGPTAFPINFRKAPGPWTVTISTTAAYLGTPLASVTSAPILVHAATPSKLQVLVQGETQDTGRPPYDAGQNGGYSGSPVLITAGVPFDITVNLVDPYFNQSETADTFVGLTTNDQFANPGMVGLGNKQTGSGNPMGRAIFSNAILQTRAPNTTQLTGWQIFASTATGDPYTMGISTYLPVQAGNAVKLLVLAPGEASQEGNTSGGGKLPGAPSGPFTVGTTYYVQVRSVDSFYNIVTSTNSTVTLTSDDPNAVPVSTDSPKAMTAGVVSFPFMLRTSETGAGGVRTTFLTASAPSYVSGAPYQSGGLVMAPDIANAVQVLVPNQTAAPGTASGKNTPSIATETAGISFPTTVRVVDRFNNKTSATPPGMHLTGTDPYDNRPTEYQPDPLALTLLAGTTSVNWTFTTANGTGWTLKATAPGLSISTDTSPSIPVTAGQAKTLQVVLPGETAVAGLGTYNLGGLGRTGVAQPWMVGVSSTVILNIVDKHFNIVPAAATTARMQSTDAYVPFQNQSFTGTTTYAFTLFTATPTASFTGTNIPGVNLDPSSSTVVSSTFSVAANSAYQLQVLVPGETAVPGSPTGKTAVGISTQAAGVSFPVTVNAVDLHWNPVVTPAQVSLATTDPYAPAQPQQTLISGATIFDMVFAKANPAPSGWTIVISTTAGSPTSLLSNTSALIPVNPGAATKLQMLLPGETALPGQTATKGKFGTPQTARAGISYSVTVNLTDDYYNIQKNATLPSATLVTSDPNDVETAFTGGNPQTLSPLTASATYGVFFFTAGTWTITANDIANAYASDTSTGIVVNPGIPQKLVWTLPGQTLQAGVGVMGAANPEPTGTNFSATVNITDSHFNVVTSTGRAPVFVTSDDPYITDFGSNTVTAGSTVMNNINAHTAGVRTLYAYDNNNQGAPVLTTAVSTFTAIPAPASRLQIVVFGETAVPGNTTLVGGVTGSPTTERRRRAIPRDGQRNGCVLESRDHGDEHRERDLHRSQ